jgi:hypothetical protein
MEAFAKARTLKPDYWPAYIGEARVLEAVGKNAEAVGSSKRGFSNCRTNPNCRTTFSTCKARWAARPAARVCATDVDSTVTGRPPL